MVSPVISQSTSGTQLPSSNSSNSSLTANDFMQLMVTQLENQDPTSPTSSSDLLQQTSEIAQLESNTQLNTTLQSSNLQSEVGSASALIGKTVSGVDSANNTITGVVNSVSVAGGTVSLQLDSGTSMALSGLASITSAATATTGS
jgi:flagellar basal-body rod modification protein FlgD